MAWYEEFFDEDYMRFHLRGGAWLAERTPQECDFVVEALALKEGDRVLDLCCGQGRHSTELARRGFHVTGVDLSEYLLGLARRAAEEANVSVRLERRDMRDLPWADEFDAAINMFTSFGYFENDKENERVLRAAGKALHPGGRLLLDLPNRQFFAKAIRQGQRDWLEHDQCLVLEEWTWSDDGRRLRMDRTIIERDWSRRHKRFDLREYAHPEIVDALTRAGVEWERTYGGVDLCEFGAGSRRMLVVARTPA